MSDSTAATDWSREQVEATAARVFDPAAVAAALQAGADTAPEALRDILHHASAQEGLTLDEVAALLQVTDPDLRREVLNAAHHVHAKLFARRISIATPVCPTNRCVNDCLYCPLRRSNAGLRRTASTGRDLQREIVALLDEGHRHVILVFGDDRSGVHYIHDMLWAAYGARSGLRQLQRVDLNVDALSIAALHEIQDAAALGTYHVFQETYDAQEYARLHPQGPKADYAWRLTCHDRAHAAGLTDVGLGVLLGAGNLHFDVLALIRHAQYLTATYGDHPQTITYPRMVASPGAPTSREPERQVADEDFLYVVGVTRLALPASDLILSTPASAELRRELYDHGISRVSVGSLSYPGTYTRDGDPTAGGELVIGRPRPLEELVYRMAEAGFVPNFCAACYAERRRAALHQRTSPQERARQHCAPNALLSLKEYLMDYASPDTRTIGERLIQKELSRLPEPVREATLGLMVEAEAGLRGQML
ncbi:MAG TPA: radical SAM protein [Armatimonadota bacterium]|jgi:2-iminoacetate synthase